VLLIPLPRKKKALLPQATLFAILLVCEHRRGQWTPPPQLKFSTNLMQKNDPQQRNACCAVKVLTSLGFSYLIFKKR
jgi:hypothetical protein